MYIETVKNRNSPPAILLRESYREGEKIKKRTLANLTKWPSYVIEGLRAVLKGTPLVQAEEHFEIRSSIPHGHVKAVLDFIKHLGLDKIIGSVRCKERDLVVAMIAERLLKPCSKLATTRLWHTTTLAEELAITGMCEDDLYSAMDWLLKRQDKIENALAQRHLQNGSMVLYDISSSYYEGHTCPLAEFGHNRDKKAGHKIIVYGLMTDDAGCPVAVNVYPGNTGDPNTVPDQVEKLQKRFRLDQVVLVGDRGMLTQTQIDKIVDKPGMGWISALRSSSIQKLMNEKVLQMSLFDKQNLAEIASPLFPNERLIACFNPLLCDDRRRNRDELLVATEKDLQCIVKDIARRTKTPLSDKDIGLKVGRVINAHKVAKHFRVNIQNGLLTWERKEESINNEMKLDGIYVIRTSESATAMTSENVVRNYKRLSQVEQAFRTLKGIDLLVRPIRHRTEDRVRSHIFICMLSYYVEWHMRKALGELLFVDEDLDVERLSRDPVAPAQPSIAVANKKKTKVNKNGIIVHSFRTLIAEMGTICKNICSTKSNSENQTFTLFTKASKFQDKVFELLKMYPVRQNVK